MHKKFEINRTKIKGVCQSETKVAELISNSELPLIFFSILGLFQSLLCQETNEKVRWLQKKFYLKNRYRVLLVNNGAKTPELVIATVLPVRLGRHLSLEKEDHLRVPIREGTRTNQHDDSPNTNVSFHAC